MSHWNHRVMKRESGGETLYGIHEVHYCGDEVEMWTSLPEPVVGESIEELRTTLTRMLAALDKPVLEVDE